MKEKGRDMIDIVVFGKPRSFESYEFEFDGHKEQTLENTHLEPFIKPVDYNIPVFHYYKKGGIAIWEVYRRCRGFDSSRDGIVFGVGIKSDKDFDLIGTLNHYLIPFWEDFADAFLDSNRSFKIDSIVDRLKSTKWSSEEKEKVLSSIKEESIPDTTNNDITLLLVAPDFSEIQKVEKVIKTYSDVYIAGDATLFQQSINKTVLTKQANNEVHIINKGKIERLPIKKAEEETATSNTNRRTWNWFGSNEGSRPSQSDNSDNDGRQKKKKTPSRFVAAIIAFCLLAMAAYFIFWSRPAADRIEFAQPEKGYIIDSFNLQPTLFHGESKRTSTRLEDIDWEREGDGIQYVEWNPQETYFKINKNYYQNKPRQETQVTVTARLGEKELGKATYKLEKCKGPKANKVIMAPCRASMKASWRIDPGLFYDNDPNVSTDLSEIQFTVSPTGIAHVDNEYKLVVDNRPDNDTQVTVTALLDGRSIGEQIYTIAKKETSSPLPTIERGSIICRKLRIDYDPTSISFTSRTIELYEFIAIDKNGNQLSGGTWSFGNNKIHIPNRNINPVRIGIGEGFNSNQTNSCKVSYKINNNTIAETTITITQITQ